ncbi:hypothetical protein D3C85_474100 [compost metagenome]
MGVGGEVLGVLVEDRLLGGGLGGLALACLGGARRLFAGRLGPFLEVAAQRFAGNAQQRGGAVQQQRAALVAVEQGEQQEAGANAVLARDAGLDHGVFEKADRLRGERRGARAAGLEQFQGLVDLRGYRVALQAEARQQAGQVAAFYVQQLQQQVFDLHVMVGALQAALGGSFQGATALCIEASDQAAEFHGQATSVWRRRVSICCSRSPRSCRPPLQRSRGGCRRSRLSGGPGRTSRRRPQSRSGPK